MEEATRRRAGLSSRYRKHGAVDSSFRASSTWLLRVPRPPGAGFGPLRIGVDFGLSWASTVGSISIALPLRVGVIQITNLG
jgi:hypothetical protein